MLDEMMFFEPWPQLFELYEVLKTALKQRYPDMKIKVTKSQISFSNRHMFACVSGPIKRKKDWPKEFVLVTFGLSHPLEHERIAMKALPYPNRWTHHVIITEPEDVDEELMSWISEAYYFSETK